MLTFVRISGTTVQQNYSSISYMSYVMSMTNELGIVFLYNFSRACRKNLWLTAFYMYCTMYVFMVAK